MDNSYTNSVSPSEEISTSQFGAIAHNRTLHKLNNHSNASVLLLSILRVWPVIFKVKRVQIHVWKI